MYDGIKLVKKADKIRTDIFTFTAKLVLHFERLLSALIVIIHLETVPIYFLNKVIKSLILIKYFFVIILLQKNRIY